MDAGIMIIMLLILVIILAAIILPIVALGISIRTRKKVAQQISILSQPTSSVGSSEQTAVLLPESIKQLEARIAGLEAAFKTGQFVIPERFAPVEPASPIEPKVDAQPGTPTASPPPPPAQTPPQPSVSWSPFPAEKIKAAQIESVIGRRWLGWAAVVLILFAAAFFLKYAFDNRWIGELGRVAIGIIAGVTLTVLGFKYHRRRWRIFSQILTGGGVVLLYLSVYAAFGYYHLASQKTAFVYLAILIVEAAGLALLYNAPAIAIMALVGGFLTPILLHSDRDQYRSLFGYIIALDVGALGLLKHWPGLSSLAFAGTHLLFWLWYGDNYHPRKIGAVMIFQTAVFLLFLLAHIGRRLKRQVAAIEDFGLLLINPFVFFATSYHLLNPNHHDWMGVLAIGMALVYAAVAKLLPDRPTTTATESLSFIGISLTFVTLAIPIQLRSNWITIAWAVEALVMLWIGIETKSQKLRIMSHALFVLALFRLLLWDTPYDRRPFTPLLNKYFLSSLAVTSCVFGAAYLYHTVAHQKRISAPKFTLVILLLGIVTLWFVMSVETVTFFATRAAAQRISADAAHQRWLGQMALSVLWSVYAAAFAAIGFFRRLPAVRWAA